MNTLKRLTTTIASAYVISFGCAEVVSAQVLISIDPTDHSAVRFTTTGATSDIRDRSTDASAGVWLVGLFSTDFDVNTGNAFTGTLSPAGTSDVYTLAENGLNTVSLLDLNLFDGDLVTGNQFFSPSQAAFSGSSTIDLTGATFGPLGSTGDILVGNSLTGSGGVIGQYEIVPEPTSLALLGLGGLLLTLHGPYLRVPQ